MQSATERHLPEGFRFIEVIPPGDRLLAEDLEFGGQVTLTALAAGRDGLPHEMRAVSALGHPAILPVRVVADGAGSAWLVSPHVPGPGLAERLAPGGALPLDATLNLLAPIADALDAAHRAGVVHGAVAAEALRFPAGADHLVLTGFGLVGGSDLRADVHGLASVAFRCLTGGQPPTEPPRVTVFRPDLPAEVDRVLTAASAPDPSYRHESCRALLDALAAAAGMGQAAAQRPPRRRRKGRVLAIGVVLLVVAGVLGAPRVIDVFRPSAAELARVPAALTTCDLAAADPRLPGVDRTLRCADPAGQQVLIGLFPDDAAASAAYEAAVAAAGVRRGESDCSRESDVEHRYPGVGEFRGRVLCERDGAGARLVWIDHPYRTVSVTEQASGSLTRLTVTWSRWVEQPAFPTTEEQELLDVLRESSCRRAPAGPLDELDDVVAAVECTPLGTGATSATYYRFVGQEAMKRAYDADVARSAVPGDVSCFDDTPQGLGEGSYAHASAIVGRALCGKTPSGGPLVSWTSDALRILGRAVGSDRAAVNTWFDNSAGVDPDAAVEATNRMLSPPFPTAEEAALLQRIPSPSRVLCSRTSETQRRGDVAEANVVAVACTTGGPIDVYYYQFGDASSLAAQFGPANGPSCLEIPPGEAGAARYTRPDGSTGTLACGRTTSGARGYYFWSDEQALIAVTAYDPDPARLGPWWPNAGPN